MARRPSSPLSEHARLLEEEHARILRELAETEKTLRQRPKPKPKPAPEQRKVRLNNVAAVTLPPRPHDHIFRDGSGQPPRRAGRRRKADARYAQIKFLLLCLLFVGLMLFVWKNLPG